MTAAASSAGPSRTASSTAVHDVRPGLKISRALSSLSVTSASSASISPTWTRATASRGSNSSNSKPVGHPSSTTKVETEHPKSAGGGVTSAQAYLDRNCTHRSSGSVVVRLHVIPGTPGHGFLQLIEI